LLPGLKTALLRYGMLGCKSFPPQSSWFSNGNELDLFRVR